MRNTIRQQLHLFSDSMILLEIQMQAKEYWLEACHDA